MHGQPTPAEKPDDAPDMLNFCAFLETKLEQAGKIPKRDRTRERLRIAAVRVLDERGYHTMRAIDVTEAAGLAEGSFYVYFKSKLDISVDILQSYFLEFLSLAAASDRGMGRLEAIQAVNRRWLQVAAANPGITRCVLQTSSEVPEIAELVTRFDRVWNERVLAGAERRGGAEVSLLAVHMLGGMMDEITRRLLVYPDPQLVAKVQDVGADLDAVADAASAVWHRILYPGLPLDAELSDPARALAGRL
ncbi:TetR/AcrR family transcriptional regulator [Sandaracinobacter neustonicus]|uniref:TetR/AcrR family transcriptional regulator n=1 Tax=Sandaracinobacter neustonicus TaxID=1715348 RepID=UPI0015E43386|nr:TetR/AcrR family transcriptional regulator [Sandaracinobacter neustonicus]